MEYKTNDKGIVSVPTISSGSITVQKAGYVKRTITAEQLEVSTEIYLQKKSDDAPVILAVWIDNTDVLTHTYGLDMLNTSTSVFSAEVDWGKSSLGNIKLIQESRSATFTGNKLETVISDNFDTSEKIYIVATDAEGRSTKKELKLENATTVKVVKSLEGAEFSMGDKISIKLPDDFKPSFFANQTISAGVSSKIPVTISADKGKINVSIGVDLVSYSYKDKSATSYSTKNTAHVIKREVDIFNKKLKDTQIFDIKGNIKDAENTEIINTDAVASSLKKLKNFNQTYKNAIKYGQGAFGFDADLTILGFAEGCYDEYGEITWLDGGIIFNPSVSMSKNFPFIVPVGPFVLPMYFETSLSADVLAQLNIFFNETAKNFTPNGEISGTIALSGAVCIGMKGVVHADGGLEGKLKPDWKIYADSEDYFKLTATLNTYVKAGIACFEGKHSFDPIYDKVWIEYPSAKSIVDAQSSEDMINLYDLSSYELKDLSYINNNSEFAANASRSNAGITELKTNIYRESTVQYAAFDDGSRIAIWIDAKDEDANNICLYYSYYDGNSWSVPKLVLDDGTMDYSPCVTKAGNTVYVAWQNATRAFAFSDTTTLKDIAPDFDISVAAFNTDDKVFTSKTLAYEGLDMIPCICNNNDEIYVAWVNNSENDWFGDNQKNSIVYSEYKGSSWSEPVDAYHDLYSIGNLAIDYNNGLHFAYSLDTDGNINTFDDIRLFEDNNRVTADDVMESSPAYLNHELYWYTQNNIISRKMESEPGNITSDRYQLIDINGQTAVVYPQANGLYSTIMMSYLNTDINTWGNAKAMTDGTAYIGSFATSIVSDNKLEILLNSTEVEEEMTDDPYGSATLLLLGETQYCDLTLGEILFDESTFNVNEPMLFTLDLTNNGTQNINSVKVEICGDDDVILSTTNISDLIVPGDTVEVAVSFIVPEAVDTQNVRIIVTPDEMDDINLSDNEQSITLGYEDVCVENMTYGVNKTGEVIVSADIVNRGYIEKTGIEVALIQSSLDGTVIDTKKIESITAMDLDTVSFTLEKGNYGIYYIAITKGDDKYIANNNDFIIVNAMEDTGSDNIANYEITLSDSSYIYDGTEKKPVITIKNANDTLVENIDYSVVYSDNIDAGIAKVTITGIGDYTGTRTLDFIINKAEQNVHVNIPVSNIKTGEKTTIIVDGIGELNYESSNTNIAAIDEQGVITGIAEGTSVITVTASGDNNYNLGSSTALITVSNNSENEEDYDSEDVLPWDLPADGHIPAGLWIANLKDSYLYTGKAIRPAVRVYDHDRRLKAGRDYTVSYKNNTKANGTSQPSKTPVVVVKGKGDYAGTETEEFNILPVDLNTLTAEHMTVAYNKKEQKKVPALYYNGKKLSRNRDFTISWLDQGADAYKAPGTYRIELTGTGNFTGTKSIQFTITDKNLIGKAKVGKIAPLSYTGKAQEPELTVTLKGAPLVKGTDYEVEYTDNVSAGTATAVLTGINQYAGTKKVNFRITGTSLKGIAVTGLENRAYDGTAQIPPVKVALNGKALAEHEDYEISYSKNVNAGKAAVTVRGIHAYTGTAKKTFRIMPYDLDGMKGQIKGTISAKYMKGGSRPEPELTFADKKLTAGKDYTISYKNNKAVTASGGKMPVMVIKGKGNFAGTLTKEFTVTNKALDDAEAPVTLTLADVPFSEKAGKCISRPILTDADGKKLAAGKDYGNVVYTLEDSSILSEKDRPDAGTKVHVSVEGKGAYTGKLTGTYQITVSDFAKAKIHILAKAYTGRAITLEPGDVTVKIGGAVLKDGEDYEIIAGSYANNIKRGKATVSIKGKGNYGGIKTVKFKITARQFAWFWRLFK